MRVDYSNVYIYYKDKNPIKMIEKVEKSTKTSYYENNET